MLHNGKEVHDYDPHGAARSTPEEACDQSYRRGAHHALCALRLLIEENTSTSPTVGLLIGLAEDLAHQARDVENEEHWKDVWMDRFIDEMVKLGYRRPDKFRTLKK